MKTKKKIMSIFMVLVLTVMSCGTSVSANGSLSMEDYQKVLDELNAELGTTYMFATKEVAGEQGKTDAEILSYYSKMTLDEFRDHMMEAHENVINSEQMEPQQTIEIEIPNNLVSPASYTKKQRYFYDATSTTKYLGINATIYYDGNATRYSSVSMIFSEGKPPYYTPTKMTTTYNTGKTQVTTVFRCLKYISDGYITDGVNYNIKVVFKVLEGDIYATL